MTSFQLSRNVVGNSNFWLCNNELMLWQSFPSALSHFHILMKRILVGPKIYSVLVKRKSNIMQIIPSWKLYLSWKILSDFMSFFVKLSMTSPFKGRIDVLHSWNTSISASLYWNSIDVLDDVRVCIQRKRGFSKILFKYIVFK